MNWILVFIGGGLGCICRYSLGLIWQPVDAKSFPTSTFFSNIFSCFVLGLIWQHVAKNPEHFGRLLLITGFCGGFSTFSSFGLETIQFIQLGYIQKAMMYVIITNLCCFIMIVFGIYIYKNIS